MSNFEQFHFKPYINEALAEKGFAQPTEVQERLIPLIAKGKNIIGSPRTLFSFKNSFCKITISPE